METGLVLVSDAEGNPGEEGTGIWKLALHTRKVLWSFKLCFAVFQFSHACCSVPNTQEKGMNLYLAEASAQCLLN